MDGTTFSAVEIPFVDPQDILADPHGTFRGLRPLTPAIRFDQTSYSVLRACDVIPLSRDTSIRQIDGAAYVAAAGIPDGEVSRFLSQLMVLSNDTDHRRRRAPFARTFAHAPMRAMRADVRRAAQRTIAEVPRGTPFDFVEWVSARLPAEMIAVILGLPAGDAPWLASVVTDLGLALSPVYPHDQHARIEAAAGLLRAYVEEMIDARQATPCGDLLSRLSAAFDGDQEELVTQVMGVILGGSDTTRAAFSMIVSLLLEHTDQWAAVKADATLIPGAVAEGIRMEPPVGNLPRFLTQDLDLDGARIPAGSMLALSTMSAMRDPAIYADPDRFDIRRNDHPRLHAAFGGGAHRCLGEMLARLEMEEALAALIAAAPDIELLEPARMSGFGGIRHVSPMTVRIR